MNWWKILKGKVRLGEPLSRHTTFKIGGKARFFLEPRDIADLKLSLALLKKYKIPYFVMGAGSNILVSDKGLKAAVVSLRAPSFSKIEFGKGYMKVGCGVLLSRALAHAVKKGFSGPEFLAGIPGTVGGALLMNAGVTHPGCSIADLIEAVTVLAPSGRIKTLRSKDLKFSYRHSNLSRYIILSARLRMHKARPQAIRNKIKEYLEYRRRTQEVSWPSAGCVFKNPRGDSAGRLIDLCA